MTKTTLETRPTANACLWCGKDKGTRAKYCSSTCGKKYGYRASRETTQRCSEHECNKPVQARGICGPHYSTWHRTNNPDSHNYICHGCGVSYTTARKAQRDKTFCTANCARAYASKQAVQARWQRRAQGKSKAPAVIPKTPRTPRNHSRPMPNGTCIWKDCICKICGTRFISKQFHNCCSIECSQEFKREYKRNAKHVRRARQRKAYVSPVRRSEIYKRDNYRCQLCGKKLKMNAEVPHPNAPTLDHIIPLSKGGTHEPTNVHAAHFLCNATKGNRGQGEQLILIA